MIMVSIGNVKVRAMGLEKNCSETVPATLKIAQLETENRLLRESKADLLDLLQQREAEADYEIALPPMDEESEADQRSRTTRRRRKRRVREEACHHQLGLGAIDGQPKCGGGIRPSGGEIAGCGYSGVDGRWDRGGAADPAQQDEVGGFVGGQSGERGGRPRRGGRGGHQCRCRRGGIAREHRRRAETRRRRDHGRPGTVRGRNIRVAIVSGGGDERGAIARSGAFNYIVKENNAKSSTHLHLHLHVCLIKMIFTTLLSRFTLSCSFDICMRLKGR